MAGLDGGLQQRIDALRHQLLDQLCESKHAWTLKKTSPASMEQRSAPRKTFSRRWISWCSTGNKPSCAMALGGDYRPAQCGQKQPAQCPQRPRARHRHRPAGHHARPLGLRPGAQGVPITLSTPLAFAPPPIALNNSALNAVALPWPAPMRWCCSMTQPRLESERHRAAQRGAGQHASGGGQQIRSCATAPATTTGHTPAAGWG